MQEYGQQTLFFIHVSLKMSYPTLLVSINIPWPCKNKLVHYTCKLCVSVFSLVSSDSLFSLSH